MATHGRLSDFDSALEDWESYVECLDMYFTANDVEASEKRRAILLSAYGAPTYRLIKNLLAPKKPTEVEYKEIVKQMATHYHPTPVVMVQRFRFNSRCHKPGESVAIFVSELKKLSEHCDFGTTLDDMLRDRLVSGIGAECWQRRLLAEPNLDYEKAFRLVQAMEAAERNVKDLQGARKQDTVLQVQSQDAGVSRREPSLCYRCGGTTSQTTVTSRTPSATIATRKGTLPRFAEVRQGTTSAAAWMWPPTQEYPSRY